MSVVKYIVLNMVILRPNICLKLFDTLVVPILSYGGTVWAPLYANKVNTSNFNDICNNSPVENLNTRMCKYLLGVHRKSTNDAVRGELGRLPLLLTVLNHSFRYFQRVMLSNSYSLVKISCLDTDVCNFNSSWHNSMIKLLNTFDQSQSFTKDMQNVYVINWKKSLQSCTGKLRTYAQFKKDFCVENYILQFPVHVRRHLTKLRISAHSLAIETGRYKTNTNASLNADKRLCFNCKTVESEYHFIFECSLYEEERKQLFESLRIFTSIPSDATHENFCTIMSGLNGDLEVSRNLCYFINNCFEIRRESINTASEKNVLLRPEVTTTRSGRLSRRPTRLNV